MEEGKDRQGEKMEKKSKWGPGKRDVKCKTGGESQRDPKKGKKKGRAAGCRRPGEKRG